MMILRSSPPSPFGRQVKIAAIHLGQMAQINAVEADTKDPNDNLRLQNPLGKIPVLVLENGQTLYDSKVIIEYLDHLAGGGKIIPLGEGRFQALTLQALANGIMEASLSNVYEKRFRPAEHQLSSWTDYQYGKICRALDQLASAPPKLESAELLHIGHIGLACALGYQDLRFSGEWRASWPILVNWLDAFRDLIPAYDKTAM